MEQVASTEAAVHGVENKKGYDLNRIRQQQYSRKVTLDGTTKIRVISPFFSVCPIFGFRRQPPFHFH
jgi:hypothetical protein